MYIIFLGLLQIIEAKFYVSSLLNDGLENKTAVMTKTVQKRERSPTLFFFALTLTEIIVPVPFKLFWRRWYFKHSFSSEHIHIYRYRCDCQ